VEERKRWTHGEADADGGSEGPRDELALVVLNQQRGLAHSAVSHQDRLQREAHIEESHDVSRLHCLCFTHRPRPLQAITLPVHLLLSAELGDL